MKLIDLLIELRKEILAVIGTVEDASGGLTWDTTRPNYVTRSELSKLLDRHLLAGERFGVFAVTRNCSCSSPNHKDDVIEKGRHGIRKYADVDFIWTGDQLFQGDRLSICPCSSKSKATTHWVIDELVIRKHGATKRHHVFVNAISDVQQAIDNAAHNKTRSAIREHLLSAMLELNDGILPQTVDQYVAARSSLGDAAKSKKKISDQNGDGPSKSVQPTAFGGG